MSLLEHDTTRKEQVDENMTKLKFDAGDSEAYEVEAIRDSAVYVIESESGYLSGLYYLIAWKGYPEEENTWEPFSTVQHLRKLIRLFHKDHPRKPTANSPPINSTPPMAKLTVKPTAKSTTKRKRGRPANSANKQVKKIKPFACSFTWLLPDHAGYLFAQFYQETSVFSPQIILLG